jgi:hypothetical protein
MEVVYYVASGVGRFMDLGLRCDCACLAKGVSHKRTPEIDLADDVDELIVELGCSDLLR